MQYISLIRSWTGRHKFIVIAAVLLIGIAVVYTTSNQSTLQASDDTSQQTTGTTYYARMMDAALPDIESKNVFDVHVLPYSSSRVTDGTLPQGTEKIKTAGKEGRRVVTYEATYINGEEISRTVLSDLTTVNPVNEVVAVGTGSASSSQCSFKSFKSFGGNDICVKLDKKSWRNWFREDT